MRRALLVSLALAALAIAAGPAAADDVAGASTERLSLEGYGAGAPLCLEWSDGCAVCARDEGAARCSTPGIACQPGPIVCRRDKTK